MIFFLASLPPLTYETLLKIFRKYEGEKKQPAKPTKPDCRGGANFRELLNLDSATVHNLLEKVEAEEMSLSSLNAECKRLKKMRRLKETFASEVGASSWEESASKYPHFATEENLERYLSTTKISGPVLAAFQQFCRRASVSVTRKQLPVCVTGTHTNNRRKRVPQHSPQTSTGRPDIQPHCRDPSLKSRLSSHTRKFLWADK